MSDRVTLESEGQPPPEDDAWLEAATAAAKRAGENEMHWQDVLRAAIEAARPFLVKAERDLTSELFVAAAEARNYLEHDYNCGCSPHASGCDCGMPRVDQRLSDALDAVVTTQPKGTSSD